MSSVPNPRLVFNAIPDGMPDAASSFRVVDQEHIIPDEVDLSGGVLVKVIALSLDPYMRNRMREPNTPGDMPAYELGQTIAGFGVGKVVRSELSGYEPGEHVYGFLPFQHYAVFPNTSTTSETEVIPALALKKLSNLHNLPWRYFAGAIGMVGQSAYYALKDITNAKAGEVIYIPAAAGAVGHLLVQFAKIKGLKVIASCGSDDKVAFVKSLGADHVFNRCTADINSELKKEGPIDVYFDAVGGATLEAAIENAAQHARFAICGMISQYNTSMDKAYGVRNLWLLNRKRIRMEGYVCIDWDEKYGEEFYDVVPRQLASGELKYREQIYHGLENVGQGIVDLLTGGNIGKPLVVLDDI